MKYVRDNFDFSDMSKLTVMNIHADYSVLQFIYKDGKITKDYLVSKIESGLISEKEYEYITGETIS